MRKKIIFLFIIVANLSFSQNYRVTYKLNISENPKALENEYMKDYYLKAMEGAKNLSFELHCEKERSIFEYTKILNINSSETKAAITKSETKKPFFIEKNFLFKIEKEKFFDKKYIIKDTLLTNWNITNETKKINNYTCYKATAKYKIINPKGVFYHPVIAWFCPEIPLQHGPRGFGGLPGLILELQYREIVFGATLIEKTNQPVVVDLNEEIISQSEYDKKLLDLRY
jgi:GLPGLI family protein